MKKEQNKSSVKSQKGIYRTTRSGNIIPNTGVFLDHRMRKIKGISLKAIGLYAYIASCSDDWNFSIRGIAGTELKDGHDSIRSAVKELEDLGLLERRKGMVRDECGKIISPITWILKTVEDAGVEVSL